MYLSLLKENEKQMFIELAYNLVNIDGDFSQEEKNMILEYCLEANCTIDEKKKIRSINKLTDEIISTSNKVSKQIIIFELVGLAMTDGKFDHLERTTLNKLSEAFNMKPEFLTDCEKEVAKYIDFQTNLNKLVLG